MRDPKDELSELESLGLRRNLRKLDSPQGRLVRLADGKECFNFSSNDYLGLANDDRLIAAFQENLARYGVGSGASRLVCGTQSPHLELESQLADFKGSEAALTFSSGFATATGVISGLCDKSDIVILDKLSHASLIDGSRLSGAKMRIFPHNDLDKLESHLQWAVEKVDANGRILLVTESIFSMDGDLAPLAEIVALKEKYGALLLLDEAHAFGVIGPQGRGLAAELGLEDRIDLQMGTFSKAAGLSGGYLCASRSLVDLMVNRARSFIYSTAPSPALAATIFNAINLIGGSDGDSLRRKLWTNISSLDSSATSAILPIIIGENAEALAASNSLLEDDFLVPAIRYPTVPRGTARLRVTLSAAHEEEEIAMLKSALSKWV